MKFFLLFWAIVLACLPAYSQTNLSNVYSYTSPGKLTGYQEQTLVEGSIRDYSHFILQAITISPNQAARPTQQFDEEVVLIIKTGELTLTLGSEQKTLGAGKFAMVMPGDDYRVDNKAEQPLVYYQMRYTSNEMPDLDLYRLLGSSFWVDWQPMDATVEQPESSRGLIPYPTVMSNRVALHIRQVAPGSGRETPHTHRAAELLFILDHPVQALIGEALKEAQVGDLIFIESAINHGIYSSDSKGGSYLSFQF